MAALAPDDPGFVYDEMSFFAENCEEYDISCPLPPAVERVGFELSSGSRLSALKWGTGTPEVVFVHGGAQNAHTWDTVMLAMGIDALAVDQPGHGHSEHSPDGSYDLARNAQAVREAIETYCATPVLLVGMSLGGLVANLVASRWPELIQHVVIVDVTPGLNAQKTKAITDFVGGPQTFTTFTELFERTVEYNPTRSASSLRRGILHNAHRLEDGGWAWNYDRRDIGHAVDGTTSGTGADMWDHISSIECGYTLLRGADSPVVDDDDVEELRRRKPDVDVRVVEGAGHSIQGDRPIQLAEILTGIALS